MSNKTLSFEDSYQMPLLREQTLSENEAMARYALNKGIPVASEILATLDAIKMHCNQHPNKTDSLIEHQVRQLVDIHHNLSKAVSPAIPRTLRLLAKEQDKRTFFYFLGPVPLVRWLSLACVFFLIAMIMIGLSDKVNSDTINMGFLNSSNQVLFYNQLFLLACSGLGATFSNLFQASSYVARNTYDPQFDSTYWSRIILGLMSGLILVELLPMQLFTENDSLKSFGKPAIAVLGGFSASLVHRVLRHAVDTVESFFKSSASADEEKSQALQDAQLAQVQAQADIVLTQRLLEVKNMLHEEKPVIDIQQQINDYLRLHLSNTQNQ